MSARAKLPMILGALAIAGFSLALQAAPASNDISYAQEIERFHRERDNSLKNSWATLAGLFWLRPGANSLGTDERKDAVALPTGTVPANAGSFELQGKDVILKLAPGTRATVDGKPVSGTLKMQPDVSGAPTRVAFANGRVRLWIIRRGERVGVRIQDRRKAEEYKPSPWYPVDPKWKIDAQWVPNTTGRKVIVPDVIGDANEVPVAGEARFKVNGQQMSMVAVEDAPGYVEFVFADPTNKNETYHAGRFLDSATPAAGKPMVLDFNTAYNPPCSVTPYATCPLPPKENRLKAPITAGQKFSGH